MTSSVASVRRPLAREFPISEQARSRSVERRVQTVWGLLFLNAIGYSGLLIHIPSIAGKAITQGALPVALVIALTVNRRLVVRPSGFLCLVTILPAAAILPALEPQFLGTVYRTVRLAEFVAVLWLLTPWWGRRDLLLVRTHLKVLLIVLGSVVAGLLVAPGQALAGGRLGGALWDIPATQVAHYAAVTIGIVVMFWLCGQARGPVALVVVCVSGAMLVLTHTRTALVGMIAAIVVGGLSLIVTKARARKLFAIGGLIVAIAVIALSRVITAWLERGQGTTEITNLTGRTKVWGPLLNLPRDPFQEIFGFGLSNSSFNGLPIDSNWLSSYQEQGLIGVSVCILILAFLFLAAYFHPPGLRRALALFLVTYCLTASFTEDGFTDATPYLLELALAASVLMPALASRTMNLVGSQPMPVLFTRRMRQ